MKQRDCPAFEEYVAKVAKKPFLCGGYRTRSHAPTRNDIPLVSIVTVTYNAEKTLLRTLQSVMAQTYRNIEHIIVDGGSTDGTLSLIQANEETIAYWRSEPDHGIYDAFNKGVALAKGEFIGILNADDYYEPDMIEKAVAALLGSKAPFVHGNIVLHGWKGQDIELHGDPNYEQKIRERMPSLFQVTTICRKSVFEKYGLFSTRYRIAGDFDWYLRLADQGCVGVHAPGVRAHMAVGGVSTTQQRRALYEALLITWRHGLALHRAVRITLPRILFPNDRPRIIRWLVRAIRNPRLALSNLYSRFVARKKPDNIPATGTENTLPVLQAFMAARQITLKVDPLGLEWIWGVGLRAGTFAIISRNSEARAADLLLTAAGARRAAAPEEADVLVVDSGQAEKYCTRQFLKRKTVLLILDESSRSGRSFPFPSLDFGGIIGLGALVDPALTLRGSPR